MKKFILAGFLLLWAAISFASTPDFSAEFQGKSGCFILFDLTKNKLIQDYNPSRCAQQIPADSTFKVPLSLMAFDQKLITQQTVFKWDGKDRGLPQWNHDQTPQTWLTNSVVWVSQELTPQLGLNKIKAYLKAFNYGNQDFSGGLTTAWLGSTLKISADEQLNFVKALVNHQLPVSQEAMTSTKANMFLETTPKGYALYGKTGSDSHDQLQEGWFIGFMTKGPQTYLIVSNFTDLLPTKTDQAGGPRAKAIVESLLTQMGLF